MGITSFLVLQVIAHLLVDFFFQSNKQANDKNKLGFKSSFLKWHTLIVFSLSWVLSFQLNFVYGALIIAVTHYVIDGLKKNINAHFKLGKYSFFIDQALHLIVIVSVVALFDKYASIQPLFNINLTYLLLFAGYAICLKPANIFIKQIFVVFDIAILENNDLPNAGKLIGTLERILVITFILLNQFGAIGFLIAAKSILRYKADDTLKTEYVLIGTMLSFGIALMVGVIINLISSTIS